MNTDATLIIDSGQGIDLQYDIAGVGARAYAFTIDWHIRVLAAIGWIALFVIERWLTSSQPSPFLVFIPAAIIYVGYHPIVEVAMKGATPGKNRAGVCIVTLEGASPTLIQILVRNLFRMLDSLPVFYGVGIMACVFSKRDQRFGDMAAGTLLVYQDDRAAIVEAAQAYAASSLSIDQVNAIRNLLDRWDALERDVQVSLAHRLLSKVGADERSDDALLLRSRLAALVGERRDDASGMPG
jgi:uncharacterized RDD family membrane protein YckC